MVARKSKRDEYPDDIFADTRMTFGEHIEELRTRMIRAIMWLLLFLVLGFILDAVGEMVRNDNIGIGRPMLKVICDPVETQVRDFYNRRVEKVAVEKLVTAAPEDIDREEIRRIQQKLKDNNYALTSLTAEERAKLRIAPEEMPVILPTGPLADALGIPREQIKKQEVQLNAQIVPAKLTYLSNK